MVDRKATIVFTEVATEDSTTLTVKTADDSSTVVRHIVTVVALSLLLIAVLILDTGISSVGNVCGPATMWFQ